MKSLSILDKFAGEHPGRRGRGKRRIDFFSHKAAVSMLASGQDKCCKDACVGPDHVHPKSGDFPLIDDFVIT